MFHAQHYAALLVSVKFGSMDFACVDAQQQSLYAPIADGWHVFLGLLFSFPREDWFPLYHEMSCLHFLSWHFF